MRTMADREMGPMLASASLGELLVADRAAVGVGIEELSDGTGLSVERIAAVESGRHDLSDTELCQLLDSYATLAPSRRPFRALIEIDLDAGSLRLRRTRRPRAIPAADRNLLHYLSIVHRHNNLKPGAEIPLKAVDLTLLRASLALRRGEVTSRLDRMTGAIAPGLVSNRSLLVAAVGTGLIVAAGAIVLIPAGRAEQRDPQAPGIDPRIDIGTPLVVERSPSDIPDLGGQPEVENPNDSSTDRGPGGADAADQGPGGADAAGVENSATVVSPPQIGTPLVLERPISAVPTTRIDTSTNGSRAPPADNLMISS